MADLVATGETTMRSTVVVGELNAVERELIVQAVARSGASPAFFQTIKRGLARMRAGHTPPLCVLVSSDVDVKALVEEIRDDAQLFGVPILVVLPRPSNEAYRMAYLAGADDAVVSAEPGALMRRLANLSLHRADVRPAATLGHVVVASAGQSSRKRVGRILRHVGFDVGYAADLRELAELSAGPNPPAFAITTEALEPGFPGLPEPGRRNVVRIGNVPVLVLEAEELEAPTRAGDQVVDLTGKLLFFADEQAKAQFKDRRASARKLYSTICSFREAGSLLPVYGVTHNASREGMYVRTLDPPRPKSSIWLELRAPGSGTPLHLRATAMWQRLPGSGSGVLPPGFGLRLDAGQCPATDLQELISGYEELAE
jgi:PilZ domain